MVCPDEEPLAAFALGALPRDQVEAIERHLAECEPCCRVVAAASHDAATTPEPGSGLETLAREAPGRYELIRELGAGGQSRVFLAHDHHLGRQVAFKVPHADAVAAFLNEARLTARLEHPGIVTIHEVGRRDDGSLYAVLELAGFDPATGRTRNLRDVLDACRSPDERVAWVPRFLDVCEAIAVAHTAHIAHGDLKPENVAVGPRGEVQVLDWGLAVDLDGPPPARRISGTPRYMSPERMHGLAPTLADDVWALGTVLDELLTGSTLEGSPLRAIVTRCRAPAASERYPDANSLANDLRAWLNDGLVSVHRYVLSERLALSLRRHRLQALAVSAVAVVALLGLALTLVQRSAARKNLAASLTRGAIDARGRFAWDLAGALFARADALAHSPARTLASTTAFGASTVRARRSLGGPVLAMARAPDGPALAIGRADGALLLVSVDDSGRQTIPAAHQGQVLGLAWADATTLLSCGEDGRLVQWDTVSVPPTGRDLLRTNVWLNGVAVHDGRAYVTADDGNLRWVDLEDGGEGAVKLEDTALYGVDVNPVTGQVAVGSWLSRVLIVDRSGALQHRLEGYSEAVLSVAFSPDGQQVAAGSRDTSVRVWDRDGKLQWVLPGHRAKVTVVRWLSQTVLASGSADEQVRFWDTHLRVPLAGASQNVAQDVRSLAVGRPGEVWVGGTRSEAWVVSSPPSSPTVLKERPCESGPAGTLFCTAQGFRWVPDGGAIVEVKTAAEAMALEGHRWPGGVLLFRRLAEHSELLAFGEEGALRWQRPVSGDRALAVDAVRGLAAVAQGQVTVPVFDLDGGVRLLETGHTAGVMDVALGGDVIVTASYDKTLKVFTVADLAPQRTLRGHTQGVRTVALARDAGVLASGGWDGMVHLWDLEQGRSIAAVEAHRGFVLSVALSPMGDRLASAGSDGTVAVWALPELTELVRLPTFGTTLSLLEWTDAEHVRAGYGWRVRDIHLPSHPEASEAVGARRGLVLDEQAIPSWLEFQAP